MTFLQSCIDCKALSSHTGYHTQERELKPINDGFGYSLYSPQCSSIEKAGHRYQIAEDKDEQGQAYSAFQTSAGVTFANISLAKTSHMVGSRQSERDLASPTCWLGVAKVTYSLGKVWPQNGNQGQGETWEGCPNQIIRMSRK